MIFSEEKEVLCKVYLAFHIGMLNSLSFRIIYLSIYSTVYSEPGTVLGAQIEICLLLPSFKEIFLKKLGIISYLVLCILAPVFFSKLLGRKRQHVILERLWPDQSQNPVCAPC